MSASRRSTSLAGIVAEAPAKLSVVARRAPSVADAFQDRVEHPDTRENGLRRRVHRQALMLMLASSLVSILALYGIWTLLRGVI
jgi:hypothetical protein